MFHIYISIIGIQQPCLVTFFAAKQVKKTDNQHKLCFSKFSVQKTSLAYSKCVVSLNLLS